MKLGRGVLAGRPRATPGRRGRGVRAALVGLFVLACGCITQYTVGGSAGGGCPDGQVACKDGCVVAGTCDGCADGKELCDGGCVPSGTCDGGADCPAGQVRCHGTCVDADTCPCDEGCDAESEVCVADVCVCRAGLTRCGSTCVDTRADPAHCGGCGGECEGSESVCQVGDCVQSCSAPLHACGGGCVDTDAHPLHCGECNKPCKSDELCVGGECREYTEISGCAACPCPDVCGEGEMDSGEGGDAADGECCDSAFLGAPVCIPGGCG